MRKLMQSLALGVAFTVLLGFAATFFRYRDKPNMPTVWDMLLHPGFIAARPFATNPVTGASAAYFPLATLCNALLYATIFYLLLQIRSAASKK